MNNAPNPALLIFEAESSTQYMIKIYRRRQRWQKFLNPTTHTSPNPLPGPNWRDRLTDLLESGQAHFITVVLLIIDIAISLTELLSSPPLCEQINNDDNNNINSSDDSEEPWYHWLGIAVLALLMVKSGLMLVGFGWSFFKRGGVVMDTVVVVTALILELGVENMNGGGGLIAIVCLWRVVRVIESAFEVSDAAIEDQIGRVLAQLDAIKIGSDLPEGPGT